MIFVKGLQMKHLRSIFRPQLRERSPGQGQHRGGRTGCHSCSRAMGNARLRLTPLPAAAGVLGSLKECGFAHSLVLGVELSSCLVSSVRTCSQYLCSVWPEVFCLLCCAVCPAPSTEGQCFSKSEFFTLPVPRLGTTFWMQHPS